MSFSCKKKETTNIILGSNKLVNCVDTLSVSYVKQVQPILNANCVRCHDASTGQNFTTYETTKPFATSGVLVDCIKGNVNEILMPPKPNKTLDTCEIKLIQIWIKQGCKNN